MAKRTTDSFFKKKDTLEDDKPKGVDKIDLNPADSTGGAKKKKRSFNVNWTKEFPWMQYPKDEDKMFCASCLHYPDIADRDSPLFKGTGSGGILEKKL